MTRIWLYGSPVLYYVDEVPDRYKPIIYANPMTPLLGRVERRAERGRGARARR